MNFSKNCNYALSDPNEQIPDPKNFEYYSTHDFHKLKHNLTVRKSSSLSILHTNICSLQGNFENLELLINNLDFQFDIICLTETWQTESSTFTPGYLEGYQKYEGIYGKSKNGGCGFYIKESISYIIRDEWNKKHKNNDSEFETCWIEIVNTKGENVIVGLTYRHPRKKDKDFLNYFQSILNKVLKEKKERNNSHR